MKKYAAISIAIGLFLLFIAACTPTPTKPTPVPPAYQPFPDGYGYMQENDALKQAVKTGDHAVVRKHGWELWAGIMQPAQGLDWPVWYTWPNTHAAFAGPPSGLPGAQPTVVPKSIKAHNSGHLIKDHVPLTYYPIPDAVVEKYPDACGNDPVNGPNCKDGGHVLFNGDIMIPTESLSKDAMDWIRDSKPPVYEKSGLDQLHTDKVPEINLPATYIVTKHMFWPVKATGLSAIPVWHDDKGPEFTGYAGYETWANLVAVDPSGKQVGQTASVTYLYGVYQIKDNEITRIPPVTAQAKVYGLQDFYYHQVTQADWDSFDEADKGIINASSYWAYNQPFGPGDYLVTVAMHVNTKEIPSWALQSVWWSDQPDAGIYAANRPDLPQAKGPWKHYLLVDSYGIPDASGNQPLAFNPYIELVIHPVATNCNTCHNRAGWPTGPVAGQASYQNPDCPDLLATLNPDSACLKPLTLTDFQWIIPDRAQ